MKNNLKSVRLLLGLSQADFADAIGYSQGAISLCEKQIQDVTPEMARKVIDAAKGRGHSVTFDDIYAINEEVRAA